MADETNVLTVLSEKATYGAANILQEAQLRLIEAYKDRDKNWEAFEEAQKQFSKAHGKFVALDKAVRDFNNACAALYKELRK